MPHITNIQELDQQLSAFNSKVSRNECVNLSNLRECSFFVGFCRLGAQIVSGSERERERERAECTICMFVFVRCCGCILVHVCVLYESTIIFGSAA